MTPPDFITRHLQRVKDQEEKHDRLCEEVLRTPVTAEEVDKIEKDLRATFPGLFASSS